MVETLESGRAALSCIKWMWVADVTKIKPLRQSSHSSSISMIEWLGQWRKYLTGKIITLRALMELSRAQHCCYLAQCFNLGFSDARWLILIETS